MGSECGLNYSLQAVFIGHLRHCNSSYSYFLTFYFLQKLMQKFSKTLSSSQPSAKELSMAINGYGKLSEVWLRLFATTRLHLQVFRYYNIVYYTDSIGFREVEMNKTPDPILSFFDEMYTVRNWFHILDGSVLFQNELKPFYWLEITLVRKLTNRMASFHFRTIRNRHV